MSLDAALGTKGSQPLCRPDGTDAAPALAAYQAASPRTANVEDVDMEDAPPQDDHRLRITLDYGTKNSSAAVRFISPTAPPASIGTIFEVRFANNKHFAPQIIGFAYDADGKRTTYWGTGVKTALKSGNLEPEDTIEMWKLCLSKEYANSPTVKQILGQLKKHKLTLVGLIALHLKLMVKAIKGEVDESVVAVDIPDVKTMPTELHITVPQMWEPPSCQMMVAAAMMVPKKLGIVDVKVIREPECATAAYLYDVSTTLARGFAIGDEFVVGDLGGATGDCMRVVYESDPSDPAKVILKSAGTPEGALCGSEFVNEMFRSWLKKRGVKGEGCNFATMCKRLGLSEIACLKKASDEFERLKLEFTDVKAEAGLIVVRGGESATQKMWTVEVTSANMVEFFNSIVWKIKKLLSKQYKFGKTRVIVITGGLGQSKYLINILKAYFEGDNEYQVEIRPAYLSPHADRAVSVGGQLRWEEIEAQDFGNDASFGLGSEEIYDDTIHTDALLEPSRMHDSPYSDDVVVSHRWTPLLTQDKKRDAGATFVSETWQYSIVPLGCKSLLVQIYWTKNTIARHAPIRKGYSSTSELEQGIEEWGPPLTIPLPDFQALGFTPEKRAKKSSAKVWEFYWRIVLNGKGPNVSITWEMAAPDQQPFDEEGRRLNVTPQTVMPTVFSLCDKDFNPFPASTM